jgi:hypothetical protein
MGATEPVVTDQRASLDARIVGRWWADRPYTVLTPVGAEFDVLCAPTLLAAVATGLPLFRENPGPVAISPRGTRFLVAPGAVLCSDMVGVRGVEIIRRGAFLPLPPSRVVAGSMTWRITPTAAGGMLGDAELVQAALRAARLPGRNG